MASRERCRLILAPPAPATQIRRQPDRSPLAQAPKTRVYDCHVRYGTAAHNSSRWALDLPESLVWLWRDCDPDHTTQELEQKAAERAEPLYRVQVVNRDAW
jgi:hypothetical protein